MGAGIGRPVFAGQQFGLSSLGLPASCWLSVGAQAGAAGWAACIGQHRPVHVWSICRGAQLSLIDPRTLPPAAGKLKDLGSMVLGKSHLTCWVCTCLGS